MAAETLLDLCGGLRLDRRRETLPPSHDIREAYDRKHYPMLLATNWPKALGSK
jgi:hypothetical protein